MQGQHAIHNLEHTTPSCSELEGSHVSGMTVSPDKVNKEAVVMRFKRLVGGQDVVMELGSPWSWLALQVFAVLLS